jgi:hypothetical protein
MFCCLAEIANGEYEQAILSAEAAHARAPSFRPPLRHLYPLYLYRADRDRARQAAEKLWRLEPDFTLARVREDPDYPAGTLRRTALLKLGDL